MQSSRDLRAERRRLESDRMHERLAAASRRKANDRDRSLRLAARCRAAMRPSLFFSKLPAEIRVMIYGFAYRDEGGSINVNLARKAPVGEKALKCAFDPLIAISKEWFNEAFDSFAQTKQFHFEDFEDLHKLCSTMPLIKKNIVSLSWRQHNAFAFPRTIEHVKASAPKVMYLQSFIGLGHLLSTHLDLIVRYPVHFVGLMKIRGLKSFRATVEDFAIKPPGLDRAESRARFEANVVRFARQINDEVTKAEGT